MRKRNLTKLALTISACFLLSANINANKPESPKAQSVEVEQNLKTVRGFVVDEFGEPMVGVVVKAIGSQKNTVTNTEGKYTLEAFNSDVLKFSQIGVAEKEERVTSSRILNVTLTID